MFARSLHPGTSLYLSNASGSEHEVADTRVQRFRSEPPPLSELARAYIVYAMCSFPTLVDWSPAMLKFLVSIPGVKQLTELFIRHTFFAQFVGGPTAEACTTLLERMRAENKGALFAYSVEVDEDEASGHSHATKDKEPIYKRIRNEMHHSIDVAAAFEETQTTASVSPNGKRTWVAVKLTAMIPNHESLIKFSVYLTQEAQKKSHNPRVQFPGCPRASDADLLICPTSLPGLPDSDLADVVDLYQDMRKICQHAQEKHVRLIVDAEYRYPAIDCITLALMREFNKYPDKGMGASKYASPLIYATFQAYLLRAPEYLAQSLKDAHKGKYSLGVKLVRGAYHEQERTMHNIPGSLSISPEPSPPVWTSKADTDSCYNACARVLIDAVAADIKASPVMPRIGVLYGSHNWDSVRLILSELERYGLAGAAGALPDDQQVKGHELPGEHVLHIPDEVTARITVGQLYGMSNGLTNYIVSRTRSSTPFVIKYIPYGALEEVMPYLARRAIENKSILGSGQALAEREQAWSAIRKHMGL
ncbi:FAD-linked oxidoreductase-like protein [Vararia minispora EC-137]|uniref:FAD-linked oxidoreductase-like protein n=1 Tax=Vararia minispora EC-137 TaxID=1314806 RepID=A0ACB8QU54_9AGAM|nr:FAD-linked oxidoreductase-like protein [Vararia minispora EC-137]